jgi:hypothetical protein
MMIDRASLISSGVILVILVFGGAAFVPTEAANRPTLSWPEVFRPDGPGMGDWIARYAAQTRVIERRRAPVQRTEAALAGYGLIGVVESDGRQWALIASPEGSWTLETGSMLAGYELVQIFADRVVFARDGSETVLQLTR